MAAGYTEYQVKLATIFHDLQKISEAATDMYSIVDFSDSVTFDKQGSAQSSGVLFNYTSAYGQALQRPSATATCYLNEGQLRMLRARSRAFCALNPYWWAVRENRINYILGAGHTLSIVSKENNEELDPKLKRDVKRELDQFIAVNEYNTVQGEKLTRGDRDGEFFLRFFDNKPDEILRVRFVEPILVQDPPGMGPEGDVWFGIKFDNQDYEEPLRYYIRPSAYDGGMTTAMQAQWRRGVPADQIQHRKFNVDKNSPRGLPSTYSVQENCTQALSTLRSMGRLVDVRARIALIRKQVNATLGQISPLLNAQRAGRIVKADGSHANAYNYSYGSIVDTNDQRSIEFPSQHIETDKIVHSLKADLQSVAAAMGLADFTISGDSSAAFANALVKEGPMDRAISRSQGALIRDDLEVYYRALQTAMDHDRLPKDTLDQIRIDIEPPAVVARDRLVNTQADEILVRNGAMSTDTMGMRAGVDPEAERDRIAHNPSPDQANAMSAAMQVVNPPPDAAISSGTRGNQSPLSNGQPSARGVPAGQEPGPKAKKRARTQKGGPLSEGLFGGAGVHFDPSKHPHGEKGHFAPTGGLNAEPEQPAGGVGAGGNKAVYQSPGDAWATSGEDWKPDHEEGGVKPAPKPTADAGKTHTVEPDKAFHAMIDPKSDMVQDIVRDAQGMSRAQFDVYCKDVDVAGVVKNWDKMQTKIYDRYEKMQFPKGYEWEDDLTDHLHDYWANTDRVKDELYSLSQGKELSAGVAHVRPSVKTPKKAAEEVEEGSYEPHSHDPPPQAHQDMASAILTPEWVDKTKREIAGLPLTGGCPRDNNGIRMEYEPGISGILLGIVDEQKIWAVDASAVMILHDSPDFVVAGNHMRWPWIPADVVLVDWSCSPNDMAHGILHEVSETRLMAQGRWPYAMAHRVANALEREYLLQLRPDLRSLVPA